MNTKNLLRDTLFRVCTVSAILLSSCAAVQAGVTLTEPLYHYLFQDGSNSGTTAPNGAMATYNASGVKPDQYSNGALDLSGNIRSNNYTSRWTGSSENNIGSLNQFTITLWVNAADLNGYQTLIALGSDDDFGAGSANSVTLRLVSGKIQATIGGAPSGNTTTLFNSSDALTTGEWAFIAISYDGTSSGTYDSIVQAAATGGSAQENKANLQVYRGNTDAATSTERKGIGYGKADPNWQVSPGTLDFGTNASIYLGNLPANGTIFVGQLADVRIYNSVLSSSDIDSIRMDYINQIPEPSSVALLVTLPGLVLLLRTFKRAPRA